MDIFYEYIIRKKYEITDYLLAAAIAVAALILSMVLFVLILMFGQYLSGIGLLLIVGVWWGAFRLIRGRSIEYEYILTNNELDIDKIIAQRGRKRLCSINFKEIEQCACISDPNFAYLYKNSEGRIVHNYAGDLAGERVYFVDFTKDAQRTRVLFQPNERILDGLKKSNPRLVAVMDKDVL